MSIYLHNEVPSSKTISKSVVYAPTPLTVALIIEPAGDPYYG